MISKRHLFTLFVCLFVLTASASPLSVAFAQEGIVEASQERPNRFRKPMPKMPVMENDEFLEKTRLVQKTPYDEKVLAYSIRIPKDWEEGEDKSSSNFILSDKLFLDLNTYYSKAKITGRSRIEIQAINLESNLTAEQWYIQYLLAGGYTAQGFVTHSENKVEALMVVMEQDYSYYLRTLVLMNGSKIIMVRYYIPVAHMNELASLQAKVLESFKVRNVIARPLAETSTYRFLDVAELTYPAEWQVFTKPLRSVDRMDVTIVNTKEFRVGEERASVTEGKVEVMLISSFVENSLVEEVANYKKKIQADGMLVGEKLPFKVELTHVKSVDFGITEIYKMVDSAKSQSDYELWFTVLVAGNYYYLLALLTPSQDENYPVWAENTQNYKIMVEKITPMVGAFIGRD